MMKKNSLFRVVVSLIISFILVSGCANIKEDPTEDWSGEQLYYAAKEQLDDGFYERAIQLYSSLDLRYPYGPYAAQGKIDVAYAYWKQDDTANALLACNRFLREHPEHKHVDYVYYLKALVNFNDDLGVMGLVMSKDLTERDPKAARDAFDTLKELVTRFPDSRYAEDAKLRMAYLVNALAQHEVTVAQYYYRRGAYVAAIGRAQDVLEQYPKTPATRIALEILSASYEKSGMFESQKGIEQLIEINFPGERISIDTERDSSWWEFWDREKAREEQSISAAGTDKPWWKFWVDEGKPPTQE